MKLAELIHVESVIPELQGTDRNGVIRELVQSLVDHGALATEDFDKVVDAAIAREKLGSTGWGKGVAVPHVKHECVKRITATVGRSVLGVDYAALDRAPVYTVFLLLSPADKPEDHLAAMEKVFRYLQKENFRRFLRQADSRESIMDLIREADEPGDE